MSQAQGIAVKVAGHVTEKTRQRENVADSFNYAVNVAACSGCGKPVTWICGGSRGNQSAGDYLHAESVKHCPACTPDAKTGSFRVRTTLPDGDAVALRFDDRLTFTPKSPATQSVDAVKMAIDALVAQLTAGTITPTAYAEAVAALSA